MTLPRGLAPLRHRAFRLLAGGQLASNVGDAFYAVALPWYVLADHGGPILLGAVLASYGVPRTALVAVGGHASDRWRPWTVMMVADTVRAVAVGALAVLAVLGPASAALLVPVAAVLGAGEGLFLPASFAIVPSLVPDEDLQAGNALTSGGTQFATLVGPAVGGAVVAVVGPASAFGVDGFTFFISALTLFGVRASKRRPLRGTSRAEDLVVDAAAAGSAGVLDLEASGRAAVASPRSAPAAHADTSSSLWRLVRSERVLQVIFAVTIAANLGSGGMGEVALPSLARGPFRVGATGYGALIAAFGGGALVGTLLAAQARRARHPALLASLAFLAEAVFMALVPYLGGALPAGAALAGLGALNGIGNVVAITGFQRWAPRALLGRLMGFIMLGSFGIFPVSVLLGGVVVRALGAAAFFPLSASILVVAVLGGLTQSSWRHFGEADGAQLKPSNLTALASQSPTSAAKFVEGAIGVDGAVGGGPRQPSGNSPNSPNRRMESELWPPESANAAE